MDQNENHRGQKRHSGGQPNDSPNGPGLRPRSVVLITIVLLLVGVGGYVGYWTATGRYAVVDPGRLYRSAECAPWRLVEECKRLGIRTVVDFREDSPKVDAEAEALGQAGIRYAHLATGQVPPPEVVDAFLEIMSDESNLPVLIHCEHGVGRTGLHAAIYRMEFQGWSKRCARWEAMLLAGFDSFQKDTDKARFIESYTPRSR
ncbi:MAG: fused DSP-PTPase phosphatase/NAD kinase-like protein [Thermodesulfobacteriota bacterium]